MIIMVTKPIYIISDLHLSDHDPHTLAAFERFIDIKARHAHALYILGDLFEAWVGDDDDTNAARTVKERLKQLAESGVTVFYMHGNRDFLVGKNFINQSGMHLLPDPSLVSFDGHDLLLSHGDLLCTLDKRYQRYRRWVHTHWVQKLFLALPREWRCRIGEMLRVKSAEKSYKKPLAIMDVNEEAVASLLKKHQVYTLVHGHTHHPFKHYYPLSHPPHTRYVLGSWDHGQAKILCYRSGELKLIDA